MLELGRRRMSVCGENKEKIQTEMCFQYSSTTRFPSIGYSEFQSRADWLPPFCVFVLRPLWRQEKKKKQLKMWLNISGIMICFSFMKREECFGLMVLLH